MSQGNLRSFSFLVGGFFQSKIYTSNTKLVSRKISVLSLSNKAKKRKENDQKSFSTTSLTTFSSLKKVLGKEEDINLHQNINILFRNYSNFESMKKDNAANKSLLHERKKLTKQLREMSHRDSTFPNDYIKFYHQERDKLSTIGSVAIFNFLSKVTAQHHLKETLNRGIYSDLMGKLFDEIPHMKERELSSLALGMAIVQSSNKRVLDSLLKHIDEKLDQNLFKNEAISKLFRAFDMYQFKDSPILKKMDKSFTVLASIQERNPVTPVQITYVARSCSNLNYKSDPLFESLENYLINYMDKFRIHQMEQIAFSFSKLGYSIDNIVPKMKEKAKDRGYAFENLVVVEEKK